MFRQLGTNSVIFVITNVTQKAAMFLLMPLYTLYLDPAAFGVLAIVTAINGFLSIAFTLGLTGAVTRRRPCYLGRPTARPGRAEHITARGAGSAGSFWPGVCPTGRDRLCVEPSGHGDSCADRPGSDGSTPNRAGA